VAVRKENFRRLLLTFEALADLGPVLAGEHDFPTAARTMLQAVQDAIGAQEGALFGYAERPAALHSVATLGFAFPDPAVVPLLPRHVHALVNLRDPDLLGPGGNQSDRYFTANGNVAPELFKCVASLRVGGRLVGALALGRRSDNAEYTADELTAVGLLANYISLAVHNHAITQTLEQRVSENLRLLASLHNFYDTALEAFATAIDIKHVNIRGHSLRVGRYAAGIAQAIGVEAGEVSGIRAAGYLHDIGKVAVDKRLFGKPSKLDPEEFREMADHTTIGHRIVSGVDFPWPMVPAVVRSHHERADASGYPDRLHLEDMSVPVRVMAVADTFDAMVTDRPYREGLSVGEALTEIVRITPQKFDPAVVQGLMIQVRRDAAGSNHVPFLDERVVCTLAPADIDQLASMLNFRTTQGRVYSA
jgi:putative nucleotidyltransferase with HDIG domain